MILIPERDKADQEMNGRPPKVTACFALNPDRRGAGYRLVATYIPSAVKLVSKKLVLGEVVSVQAIHGPSLED